MDPREIQSLEELCIQDDAPWCQAECPLHVDVRSMLAAVSRGDFHAASAVYAKKVPFPGILSRICDEPCHTVCKRQEAGGSINIELLERSCAEFAGFKAEPSARFPVAKTGRVAVVGGGLSGLAAALDLAKRHEVTLFDAAARLGGALRDFPPEVLPPDLVDEEIERVRRSGVEFRLGVRLGEDVSLADLLEEYDAVYLSTGETPDTDIDELTLATDREGLFAGGSLRRGRECGDAGGAGGNGARACSPVASIADGRRAANSIGRMLRGESLTSQRDKEGSYAPRLYTSLHGVGPAAPVAPMGPGDGYTQGEAAEEAARCLQCECLECVKACEYLQHFDEYPGKCIRKVTKNITSLPGKSYRTHTKFINACSLCGLCGAVCPTDLDMAVVNSEARRNMVERGFMPPAIHDFAVRDMESSDDASSLIVRHQPGHDASAYVFFPGCQLAASASVNVQRAYAHLAATLTGGVGLMLGCCGAPASWSGRQPLYEQRRREIAAQWETLGKPRVILACPTCSLMFGDGLPEIPAVSLWEVLDQAGLPAGAQPGRGATLAVHDSCTARSVPQMQDAVRSIVAKLGYQVEELEYSRDLTKCCSYGGLMSLVNLEVSGKVLEARTAESPSDYVTYCSNCRDLFAEKGKASYHVLDLLFGEYRPGAVAAGPTLSERRGNRRSLAARMLAESWGETMPAPPAHTRLKVRIPAELAARMERDRILVEDVQQVIHQAETSGDKLALPEAGRFIAHYRPGLVTYWVEYAVDGDEFEVCNAYSHRMRIVDDPVAGDDSRDA